MEKIPRAKAGEVVKQRLHGPRTSRAGDPRARAHDCARINQGLRMNFHFFKAAIGNAEILKWTTDHGTTGLRTT